LTPIVRRYYAIQLLWRYETGGWVGSSSAVVDGVVYQGPVDGYGYALDASTGELRWLRDGQQSNPLHPPLGTAWCTWGPRATTSMPCMLAIA